MDDETNIVLVTAFDALRHCAAAFQTLRSEDLALADVRVIYGAAAQILAASFDAHVQVDTRIPVPEWLVCIEK